MAVLVSELVNVKYRNRSFCGYCYTAVHENRYRLHANRIPSPGCLDNPLQQQAYCHYCVDLLYGQQYNTHPTRTVQFAPTVPTVCGDGYQRTADRKHRYFGSVSGYGNSPFGGEGGDIGIPPHHKAFLWYVKIATSGQRVIALPACG